MQILIEALKAFYELFHRYFIGYDNVMSKEAKEIFAVKEDRQKYTDAVDRIKKGSKSEILTFSTNKTITLIN